MKYENEGFDNLKQTDGKNKSVSVEIWKIIIYFNMYMNCRKDSILLYIFR